MSTSDGTEKDLVEIIFGLREGRIQNLWKCLALLRHKVRLPFCAAKWDNVPFSRAWSPTMEKSLASVNWGFGPAPSH